MKGQGLFEVVSVDPKAKTVELKCGTGESIRLLSPRADFLGIPLIKFSEHPKVGVTLQVPAVEEAFTTAHGLNPPGK